MSITSSIGKLIIENFGMRFNRSRRETGGKKFLRKDPRVSIAHPSKRGYFLVVVDVNDETSNKIKGGNDAFSEEELQYECG